MHGAQAFLEALTVVLCVAGVTTLLFQRLRQPVVLGYILAGLIIGPHLPIPLVADPDVVHTLSELGVILLMFSLGLEFSIGKLVRVGPTAAVTAVIQSGLMILVGFGIGRAFGWTTLESVFVGAIIAISSTTIIAKAFDEQGVGGRLRELVVGVLIVEDLIAILLMATLTAVSTGSGLTAGALALTLGELAAFLAALLVGGMLVVPRLVRATVRLGRSETILVSAIGICFACALLAHQAGYSVALGAFLAGSLVAESGEEKTVEHLVEPVRDVFAAIFFVSVGMLIDPALVIEHWVAIVVLTVVVIVGKVVGVTLGAFLTGNGVRTSVKAGMSLAQIGEFSFIIASLGLSLKATGAFLYPVAVAVSAVTTLTTPWLIRAAGPAASWLDRALPPSLQTFTSLYGSWLERMRAGRHEVTARSAIRRLVRAIVLDVALLAAIAIATALATPRIEAALAAGLGLGAGTTLAVVTVAAVVLSAPFAIGVVRLARRLGARLAHLAMPAVQEGALDLSAAPRRTLVLALQLAILVASGIPLIAITQPFIPGPTIPLVLAAVVAGVGFLFWRSAEDLHGHARAGAEMIIEMLAAQSLAPGSGNGHAARPDAAAAAPPAAPPTDGVSQVLEGLGAPEPVTIPPASPAIGRTLAELDLRGQTGATVLAIRRADAGVHLPSAGEVLREGDVLALAGSREAIAAGRALLAPPAAATDAEPDAGSA